MSDRPRWSSDRPKRSELMENTEKKGEGEGPRKKRTKIEEVEFEKQKRALQEALAFIRKRPF